MTDYFWGEDGEEEKVVLTDEQYMKMALNEAEKAFKAGEVPIGAVIVHEGEVIAKAWNQVEMLKDATAHAEILEIGRAHV